MKLSQPTQWKKDNPEKTKLMRQREKFKSRYGLTIEEYDEMVLQREGRCDICHRIPVGKGSAAKLNVDHFEKDGKIVIRGLLCWQCNVAIGYLQHEILRLEAAITYLNIWGGSNP